MKIIIITVLAIFFIGCAEKTINTQTENKVEKVKVKEEIKVEPIKSTKTIKTKPITTKDPRVIVGQTASIRIDELGINYLARIDTGATVTSINAFNIKVIQPAKEEFIKYKKNYQPKETKIDDRKIKNHDYKKNIGKKISFDTLNEKGKFISVKSEVVDVQTVRNAQGTEYRYVVLFTLDYKGISKKYRINLRDRRHMTYKLLIGRNWLSQHFLVNVDKEEGLLVPKK